MQLRTRVEKLEGRGPGPDGLPLIFVDFVSPGGTAKVGLAYTAGGQIMPHEGESDEAFTARAKAPMVKRKPR